MKAYEIIQKQLQLLLDVSESLKDRTDKESIELLCQISNAMSRLTDVIPDELL